MGRNLVTKTYNHKEISEIITGSIMIVMQDDVKLDEESTLCKPLIVNIGDDYKEMIPLFPDEEAALRALEIMEVGDVYKLKKIDDGNKFLMDVLDVFDVVYNPPLTKDDTHKPIRVTRER